MSRVFLAIGVCFLALNSTGCMLDIFDGGEPGSGVIDSETRELESFDKVHLSGIGEVTVLFAETSSIEITTDENLLEFVETEVVDSRLRIGLSESISPTDGLKLKIKTPDVKEFHMSGAGSLNMKDFTGEFLNLKTSGAGSMTVTGVTDSVLVRISGAGSATLDELVAKTANVKVSGAGSASVNVVETLDVNISGVGSVTYRGEPNVNQTVSGMGSVSQSSKSNLDAGNDD